MLSTVMSRFSKQEACIGCSPLLAGVDADFDSAGFTESL